MKKYKVMFYSLLNGLLVGIIFLAGLGFLMAAIGNVARSLIAVLLAIAVAFVATAVLATAVLAAVVIITAATTATTAVVVGTGSIPAGMLFFTTIIVVGLGYLIIYHKFKEQKDATIITMLATIIGVILIGFVPAAKIAYVQLIPKDQRIIRSLERKDLIFTLPTNQERYLKEFFFLRQKDGNLISFWDGKFELEKNIHRFVLPDGSVKNETREMMTVSFDEIDPTTIEGLIIQHLFAPLTEIPLETIGKQ